MNVSASGMAYPTNEELLELMPELMEDEFSYAAEVCSKATGVGSTIFRLCLDKAALEYARAILDKWGNPTNQADY